MPEPKIKPRIDESGVRWCDPGCPYYDESDQPEFDNPAEIDLCAKGAAQSPCPVATARFAAENAEMRELISEARDSDYGELTPEWFEKASALLERTEQRGTWTDGGRVWESEPEGGE